MPSLGVRRWSKRCHWFGGDTRQSYIFCHHSFWKKLHIAKQKIPAVVYNVLFVKPSCKMLGLLRWRSRLYFFKKWKLPPKILYTVLCWKRDSVLPDCFALAVNHMILGNKTWHNNHSAFVAEPITGYCAQQYWVLMWPGL